MEMHDQQLVIRRGPRLIPIQRVAPADIYAALRRYGVGEAAAAGVAAKLVTVRLEAK